MFDDNGSFLLALFEFFLFFAWFMCLFWIFGDLFRDKTVSGVGKTLWSLFLIILPLLGMLVYLIVRGGGMSDRALRDATEAQKRQEAYIRSVASPADGKRSATEEIASAKSLLDSGAITAAEFDRLKANALGQSAAPTAA
ncbi:SHOCT domain-containing protein [Paractinoplanes rhizophilus]|uniref:SHOCT domain-containing protein n=1 Tax=Paractinoplanes rhizophilus TaxID=1416877 RepID=A0ABW2HPN3_9ACTN|nr:SHOCT domain-containing protein [Actinoplanes sp.]